MVEQTRAVPEERNAQWALRELEAALRGLQFGQVTVIVQDGVVVQVERLERKRFQRAVRREANHETRNHDRG